MMLPGDEFFREGDSIEVVSIQQEDIAFHQHPYLEMVYVTGGRGLHTLGRLETTVQKGDYFIVNYGTEHKYTMIGGQRFDLINVLFKPELIDKSLQRCRSFEDLINHYLIQVSYSALEMNPTNVIYHDEDGSIYELVDKIRTEFEGKPPGYIALIRCHMIEIIVKTMGTILKKDKTDFGGGVGDAVKTYVDEHYMEDVSLSRLAGELGFSLSYLCRKFKEETGFTFSAYLQRRRMIQSGRLIANTDKSVNEVAGLVGYADMKFFGSLFKKHWGMTPSEFKKAYK